MSNQTWEDLLVPKRIATVLLKHGFTFPTHIQSLSLPSAIRDGKDIVGAAETGSGKTLAFSIPILSRIIRTDTCDSTVSTKSQRTEKCTTSSVNSLVSKTLDPELDSEAEPETINLGYGFDFDDFEEFNGSDVNLSPDEDSEEIVLKVPPKVSKPASESIYSPVALILTPTRELAIQVRDHITRISKELNISVCAIVGGMSVDKQRRLLRKQPDIIIATPGRLWDLVKEKTPQLEHLDLIKFLVIDEADRMIEKGHFQELSKLLGYLNGESDTPKKRQTFVFSATLTLVHSGPERQPVKRKRKFKTMSIESKLDELMTRVGVDPKAKVIDLTQKTGTAETLVESRISSSMEDKDLYLYYFLTKYTGRTLVFTNSKDGIRRLVSVLRLLRCKPLVLHADMRQRQRLKNLDRFKADDNGLLLATDVAARGLDIVNVNHVIHFQVARTSENYVHRSGRTARASKEGLSVMLVSPEDLSNYRKIIKTLNRNEDLPSFPVEDEYMPALRKRVNLARQIDKLQHSLDKQTHESKWFEKLAEEADLEIDEDEDNQTIHSVRSRSNSDDSATKQRLARLNHELTRLLQQPVTCTKYSGKYPTQAGAVTLPYFKANLEKSEAVANMKEEIQRESIPQPSRKRRKKTKS